MNADQALVTGYSHHVCQDFSRSGLDLRQQPFVIISDGCSGSPDTDTGSRLITHSMANLIRFGSPVWEEEGRARLLMRMAVGDAIHTASRLCISRMSCDATLLIALVDSDKFRIFVYGDGVVALDHKSQGLIVHEISFDSDVPGHAFPDYPSYMLQPDREEAYCKKLLSLKIEKVLTTHEDGETTKSSLLTKIVNFEGEISDFNWVAIFSDGVQSFNRPMGDFYFGQREPVSGLEIVSLLCDFKNFRGPFVQRRLNRFLKDRAKENWKHEDDVSVGVINLNA